MSSAPSQQPVSFAPPARVSVLLGGISVEREVSLVSGAAAAKALAEAGYQVSTIDVPRNPADLAQALEFQRPDVVFNALHGRFGEDGAIQGLLDLMGLPYTHSGRLASAVAMDKPMAKAVFREAGLPVATHKVVTISEVRRADPLPRPYVLKPFNEGSSCGVVILQPGGNDEPLAPERWSFAETVMAEPFVPGRDMTVTVMGDRALAVTEIVTERSFYDYDAKYAAGGSRHLLPAPIPEAVAAHLMELSVKAHQALGCRGVSRADFRLNGEEAVLLEINTQPGMTPTSLVPEQAEHVGISFPELTRWMVEAAACDP
ncbi:MAG: D-alanine--D-alanine ligase [Rhodospirillaceae bacterium]